MSTEALILQSRRGFRLDSPTCRREHSQRYEIPANMHDPEDFDSLGALVVRCTASRLWARTHPFLAALRTLRGVLAFASCRPVSLYLKGQNLGRIPMKSRTAAARKATARTTIQKGISMRPPPPRRV